MENVLEKVFTNFDELLVRKRQIILELMEFELGEDRHWPLVRKQLLKFMGDSGLRGDMRKIIDEAKGKKEE